MQPRKSQKMALTLHTGLDVEEIIFLNNRTLTLFILLLSISKKLLTYSIIIQLAQTTRYVPTIRQNCTKQKYNRQRIFLSLQYRLEIECYVCSSDNLLDDSDNRTHSQLGLAHKIRSILACNLADGHIMYSSLIRPFVVLLLY